MSLYNVSVILSRNLQDYNVAVIQFNISVLYEECDVSSCFTVTVLYAGDLFSLEIKARRGSPSSFVVADSIHQSMEESMNPWVNPRHKRGKITFLNAH